MSTRQVPEVVGTLKSYTEIELYTLKKSIYKILIDYAHFFCVATRFLPY